MQPMLIATPHVKCYINGSVFGYVTSVQYQVDTRHDEINGIDQIQSQELVPSNYIITGSIGVVRPRNGGGLEGAGVTAFADQLPRQKYITVMLLDIVTNNVIFQANQCVVMSQNWQITPKGLMQGTFNIKAITYTSDAYQPDTDNAQAAI